MAAAVEDATVTVSYRHLGPPAPDVARVVMGSGRRRIKDYSPTTSSRAAAILVRAGVPAQAIEEVVNLMGDREAVIEIMGDGGSVSSADWSHQALRNCGLPSGDLAALLASDRRINQKARA